jgi:hypothetical protein
MGLEYLALTMIRFPDLPVRSESLYRLRYPGLLTNERRKYILAKFQPVQKS